MPLRIVRKVILNQCRISDKEFVKFWTYSSSVYYYLRILSPIHFSNLLAIYLNLSLFTSDSNATSIDHEPRKCSLSWRDPVIIGGPSLTSRLSTSPCNFVQKSASPDVEPSLANSILRASHYTIPYHWFTTSRQSCFLSLFSCMFAQLIDGLIPSTNNAADPGYVRAGFVRFRRSAYR